MTIDIVPANLSQTPFDSICHFDEENNEYWVARELMTVLGYKTWQKFSDAIERAKIACENTQNLITEHFLPMSVN